MSDYKNKEYDEKKEWENYIEGSNMDTKNKNILLRKLSEYSGELSDEFKDEILDSIENIKKKSISMLDSLEKDAGAWDWIKEKFKGKKDKKPSKITSPETVNVKSPKVKSPTKPHLHRQDDSKTELLGLAQQGYDKAVFIALDIACPICKSFNGQEFDLLDLSNNAPHDAPIFGHVHVNCNCIYEVYDSKDPERARVQVGAGNRMANISIKDKLNKKAFPWFEDKQHNIVDLEVEKIEPKERKKTINDFLNGEVEIKGISVRDLLSSDVNVLKKIVDYPKIASVIDYPYETLPQDLWEKKNNKYILRQNIKEQILKTVNQVLSNGFNVEHKNDWLQEILFGGSAGTYFYLGNASDIDLKIVIEYKGFLDDNPQYRELYEKDKKELQKELVKVTRINEYKINEHPLDFYVYDISEFTQGEFLNKYDNLYDIEKEVWIKEPFDIDISTWDRGTIVKRGMDGAIKWAQTWDLSIGNMKREIRSYEIIMQHLILLSKEEKNKFKEDIQKILVDIQNEIEKMVEGKKEVVELRHKIFEEDFKPNLEEYYFSINFLPENIQFKLLQEFGYFSLIKGLEKLLEDDGKITEEEIPEVKKIIKENTISIRDKLKKISEEQITKEMEDWFTKRTQRHIDLVKDNMKIFAENLDGFDKDELIRRGEEHDKSKWREPERTPYIFITWQYKCKDDNVPFKISGDMKDRMNQCTQHHVLNNSHHPEASSGKKVDLINRDDRDQPVKEIIDATKMKDIDIIEMVADWYGMSEEKKTNVKDWAKKNINVRWKFTPEQEKFIYELIDLLISKKQKQSYISVMDKLKYGSPVLYNIQKNIMEDIGIDIMPAWKQKQFIQNLLSGDDVEILDEDMNEIKLININDYDPDTKKILREMLQTLKNEQPQFGVSVAKKTKKGE